MLGYLVFRSGVSEANKRLPRNARSALAPDQGSLLSNPTAILLLGTDHSLAAARAGDRHSDSITLLRTDPPHHRLYYLSIPRDLRVEIPGYGGAKINTAFQVGGPRLAARTVSAYTDIPINHIVVVNFAEFKDLIDAVGGIDVVVPRADPVEVRLPATRPRPAARAGRAGASPGQAAPERPAGADLLARAQERAQPGRERHHARRAQPAGAAGADEQARELLHLHAPAVRSATTC